MAKIKTISGWKGPRGQNDNPGTVNTTRSKGGPQTQSKRPVSTVPKLGDVTPTK